MFLLSVAPIHAIAAFSPRSRRFSPPISLRSSSSSNTLWQLQHPLPWKLAHCRNGLSDSAAKNPVIIIDNYDSFTYNLCQYVGSQGYPFEVYRNDELTIEELRKKQPSGILISPGPGTPKDSGISLEVVLKFGPHVPVFGVCMGLQCIGEAFGGKIIRSPFGVVHGKKSLVYYDECGEDGLLAGLPNPFVAGRYHSLVIDSETFPSDKLEITAWTNDGLIMGVRHKVHRHIQGVQFHPESIITENGMKIVANFLMSLERQHAFEYK